MEHMEHCPGAKNRPFRKYGFWRNRKAENGPVHASCHTRVAGSRTATAFEDWKRTAVGRLTTRLPTLHIRVCWTDVAVAFRCAG
ncbi:hypothetical protein AMC99_00625 [Altererythrobacter epoxidivorans]|uniref:Uncharacterized protein n=1 Tax=Altererythrobacter epoxidivorans TaxID=361183 RepID=A0A0M4M6L9_9SPHN|nr:hypothetical protein AMC99_00625 [Altererythrobacter epoxidivorans]